jgi:hypothetical protein
VGKANNLQAIFLNHYLQLPDQNHPSSKRGTKQESPSMSVALLCHLVIDIGKVEQYAGGAFVASGRVKLLAMLHVRGGFHSLELPKAAQGTDFDFAAIVGLNGGTKPR